MSFNKMKALQSLATQQGIKIETVSQFAEFAKQNSRLTRQG